jgi:hypothetical protein
VTAAFEVVPVEGETGSISTSSSRTSSSTCSDSKLASSHGYWLVQYLVLPVPVRSTCTVVAVVKRQGGQAGSSSENLNQYHQ